MFIEKDNNFLHIFPLLKHQVATTNTAFSKDKTSLRRFITVFWPVYYSQQQNSIQILFPLCGFSSCWAFVHFFYLYLCCLWLLFGMCLKGIFNNVQTICKGPKHYELQQNTNFYPISSAGLSHASIAISGNGQTLLTRFHP